MARPVTLGMINVMLKSESLAGRREQLLKDVDDAGKQGCNIVMLPEFADHHKTSEAYAAHSKGPEQVRAVAGLTLKSPFMQDLAGLARKHKMVVIPDVLFLEDNRKRNTCVVYGPEGSVLGLYSKTHLAPGECNTVEAGDSLKPVTTPFGKLGLFICYDVQFPEIPRVYEVEGAEILLWTTMRQCEHEDGQFRQILPARCIETGLPLGVATYVTEHQRIGRKPMSSHIYNALGQVVAGGSYKGGVVRGTLDLDEVNLERRSWEKPDWVNASSYFRRQRRPDLYGALTRPLSAEEKNPDNEPAIQKVDNYNPSL
jgi:predicted amidohydrolase